MLQFGANKHKGMAPVSLIGFQEKYFMVSTKILFSLSVIEGYRIVFIIGHVGCLKEVQLRIHATETSYSSGISLQE